MNGGEGADMEIEGISLDGETAELHFRNPIVCINKNCRAGVLEEAA